MRFLPILLFVLFDSYLEAQNCDKLIRNADAALAGMHYAKAIEWYSAAIECNPAVEDKFQPDIERAARLLAKSLKGKKYPRMLPSKAGRAAFNAALVSYWLRRDSVLAWAIARYNLVNHPPNENYRNTYALIATDMHVWPNQTGVVSCVGHTGNVSSVAFSPDGQVVLSASWDSTARVWDMHGQELWRYADPASKLCSVACSPDAAYLLAGARDGKALLFAWKPLAAIEAITDSTALGLSGKVLISPHFGEYTRQPQPVQIFAGHGATINSVAFSPDGRYVLTGSRDGVAKKWDLKGNEIQTCAGRDQIVWSAVFGPADTPGNEQILTAGSDKTARLWNPAGAVVQEFTGHSAAVSCAVFSPDGKYLVTASGDSTAILWNLNGMPLRVFRGHGNAVWSAAFSPDGQYLVTGSWDKTARLWKIETGELLQTFAGHTGPVFSVAFSPDGQKIATGSADSTVRIWHIGADSLECRARKFTVQALRAAGVQLEPEDWQ